MPTTAPKTKSASSASATTAKRATKPAKTSSNKTSPKVAELKRAEAHIRYIHMAPQKVQRIASLVRGLRVLDAEAMLATLPKRASVPVTKALGSARANAVHNYDMDAKLTWIESIRVGQSMELPRMMPRAQGRAYRIRKRFCHIDVVLVERAAQPAVKTARAPKTAAKAVKPAKSADKRPSVIRETKMK